MVRARAACPICRERDSWQAHAIAHGVAASDAAAPPIRRAAAGPPPSPPRCGAEECLCRFGREFDGARARRTRGALRGGGDDAEDAWEDFRLVRCGSCAEAHCAHARCAGLGRAARAWTCELCTRAAVNATAAQRPPPIAERRVTRAAASPCIPRARPGTVSVRAYAPWRVRAGEEHARS